MTSTSALTTRAASSRFATVSTSTAEHGIRSAPAWFTTPPCICRAPKRTAPLAAEPGTPPTNKAPTAPYGGAGRPEAAFAMERIVDLVAGELGLEPADVRLRNMIRADEMPYRVGIPYRDGEPIVYDGGDYPRALRQALAALGGLADFRERQRAARHHG